MKKALIAGTCVGIAVERDGRPGAKLDLLHVHAAARLSRGTRVLPRAPARPARGALSADEGGLEQFIRANGKNDPEALIKGVDNNIQRALSGLKSCQSEDFRLAQQAMDQLTEPENEAMVNGTLKIPRDPQLGSCG